ncbi:MAG: AGE family epimerase/isomerase [Anaerolineae bacterium]|nr:AGE family epimerase/isomerase [Anaerolineae bacterium]
MRRAELERLRDLYRRTLLQDVVPFWLRHSLDREYGGYLTCLDRAGLPYGWDKAMWLQARQVWLFAKLYHTVEPRDEWLDAARLGYAFMLQHGFDAAGRMFFSVTRDGRPLRQRRYLFTETFGVIACAEYARATGDPAALRRAVDTYRLLVRLHRTPGALPPKVIPETRRTVALAMPMILIATTQELRQAHNDPLYDQVVDQAIAEISEHFLKREERALHETVGPEGQRLDSPEGRLVNPGHAIEVSWFLMHAARQRDDPALLAQAVDILDWSLDWGWDEAYGGLLYFVDIEGRPPEQLEWDLKLWWPHTEALYATLLAHHLTGAERFAAWHERIRAWAFDHLADPEHGEWFGYLHRDGSVCLQAKGSMWKGAFHLPRALWLCARLLDEMLAAA